MRRTPQQITGAVITGALIGGCGGWALGSPLDMSASWAVLGAFAAGVVAGWADWRRTPESTQPLIVRILFSVLLAAAMGALLEALLPAWPSPVAGALVGLGVGIMGLRPRKLILGVAVGVLVGWAMGAWYPESGWSWIFAVVVLIYRSLTALIWRNRGQIDIAAEQARTEAVPFVVPMIERSGYVGVDYLKRYAEEIGGTFRRNPLDVGIVESFDALSGPGFDPYRVHPLIREFYEHTSRFKLTITPEWRWWMRLPYKVYRASLARPLGQANAPFEIEEVQRGVISWIDTLDIDDDGVPDLRAWIRAYELDREPIYVGIYTITTIEGVSCVSVGFPLPAGSFTATLLPSLRGEDGFMLSSDTALEFTGHYLSFVSDEEGITSLKLNSFGERIEVFVDDGELKTDHSFTLGGVRFLTLHYEIERTPNL